MGCELPMARDLIAQASTSSEEARDSFACMTGSRYWNANSSSCGLAN